MAVHALRKEKPEAGVSFRGTRPTSVTVLQHKYATATASLSTHFSLIDDWLAEHEPDLWKQIRQEDDDLFRLRQLGVPEQTYQGRLDTLIKLCQKAEQLYYEARPAELSLPALAEGEQVAVYFELANGSLIKVSGEDE